MASSINASTSGAGGVITTADNTGILNLQTASTTAVTVDASQNVGIGTTSPTSKLQVNGKVTLTGGEDNQIEWNNNSQLWRLNNSSAGQLYLYDVTGAKFPFKINAGSGNDSIAITSTSTAFGVGGTERMRIDSSGNVIVNSTAQLGIGKFSVLFAGSSNNGIEIQDSTTTTGAVFSGFRNSAGTLIGSISRNTTTNAVLYNTSSDYRLKENITPLTNALDKISALKPCKWIWKECDGIEGEGFIAHEVQEVIPAAVSGEKDAVDEEGNIKAQGMDTSYLVATLTAAIQEQQTIINDLKARVEALEAK
jgi:hypothetical protein